MKARLLPLLAALAMLVGAPTTYLGATAASAAAPAVTLVPTFSSVSVYWAPPRGSDARTATVSYRAAGTKEWTQGHDLSFDGRGLAGRPDEYRGSLVGLAAGTAYEVRLALAGTDTTASGTVTTWRETFPVGATVELPATSTKPLDLSETGSARGYVLVTGPGGGPATIDVKGAADYAVRLSDSSHVILRGLTLKGARRHGILLDDGVSDVVIERSSISGWGTADSSGFGRNLDSGIYSDSDDLARVVVQGNRISSPRTTSNSWKELHDGSYHPEGPQGITFRRGLGNHVIRFNDIVGDATHHFNDALGATANFGYNGFPGKDSDIHGNYIAYTWDDGIEAEGGGMNVRLYDNYMTEVYHSFGLASVSLGPLYAFRNVQDVTRSDADATWGQAMFKMGGRTSGTTFYGDGRTYLFHNTVLDPATGPQTRKPVEAGDGRVLRNVVSRNNIWRTGAASGTPSIDDEARSTTNSFDFDLYNGLLEAAPGAQRSGVRGEPVHVAGWGMDPDTRTGEFALAPGSPGVDAGVPLPGFSDDWRGSAPDMGAQESGSDARVYGAAGLPAR